MGAHLNQRTLAIERAPRYRLKWREDRRRNADDAILESINEQLSDRTVRWLEDGSDTIGIVTTNPTAQTKRGTWQTLPSRAAVETYSRVQASDRVFESDLETSSLLAVNDDQISTCG